MPDTSVKPASHIAPDPAGRRVQNLRETETNQTSYRSRRVTVVCRARKSPSPGSRDSHSGRAAVRPSPQLSQPEWGHLQPGRCAGEATPPRGSKPCPGPQGQPNRKGKGQDTTGLHASISVVLDRMLRPLNAVPQVVLSPHHHKNYFSCHFITVTLLQ